MDGFYNRAPFEFSRTDSILVSNKYLNRFEDVIGEEIGELKIEGVGDYKIEKS
jgi:hypothetical protein